jgi:AraC-like DNA-binding protein
MSEVFETEDLEMAEQALIRGYGNLRVSARGQRRGMRLSQASLTPQARLDDARFAMSLDAVAAPLGTLVFGELKSGRVGYRSDHSERYYRPGQVYLTAQPDHCYTATVDDSEVELAVIDPALLSLVADPAPGRRPGPVRFTGYEPVSPQAARLWCATYEFVRDMMLTSPEAAAAPLVAASASRLLVATALTAFPSNLLTDPTIEDRHDAHPASVRRAVAFIEENAHLDITIADIAAAASVTIRAVQLAFQRHLGVTPGEYLRRVRLDRAHRDLLAADPRHESVTAVAYRWGFGSSSRFAALYRQAYGVPPSRTLSHG